MKEIGDKGLMSEKELVWSMWPGGIQPATAEPAISESRGLVSLSSDTDGASIAYMINKNTQTPHKRWLLYHEPVTLAPGDTILAAKHRIGINRVGR